MRIGLVCPYSFDMPGGVQFHVRDLAEKLLEQGESVQVLAPADEKTEIPDYVTSSGGALPVRYNGSVARLSFGPVAAARTQRWLAGGDFDVVHIHEPFAPSVSLIALRQAEAPVVATFHSAQTRPGHCRRPTPWCARVWSVSGPGSPSARMPAAPWWTTSAGTR
ncbi:glycosyltransferase [Sanguibacter sp. Z1732]|uniref:glycosyltransferase n=1 Tax=Sanguibacter sp. Z1732 TaxID=3435412 RepID=UPI003D9CA890